MKAFLAGLGIGTLLGIAFAPAAGEQTRRNIADAANERFGDIGGRISDAKEQVQERVSSTRDQLSDYADNFRQALDKSGGILAIINEWPEQRLIEIHGIGPVLASKIIQNRPYEAEQDLIDSKILPPSAIDALRQAS